MTHTAGWPPVQPFFDRDVPIDGGMFTLDRVLYCVTVEHVTPARDLDAWNVAVEVRADQTWHLKLCIATSIVTLFDHPEQVARHVLDTLRDWATQPSAARPTSLYL